MNRQTMPAIFAWTLCGLGCLLAPAANSQQLTPQTPLPIEKRAGTIEIDGDLSDAGWHNALRIDTWYETNPRDNVPPDAQNIAWLTYDEKYFYVDNWEGCGESRGLGGDAP